MPHHGDHIELNDSHEARKHNRQRSIDEAHKRRMRYCTNLLKTISSPVIWVLTSTYTAVDTQRSRIGKESNEESPPKVVYPVEVSERPNTLDIPGLAHRRSEKTQTTTLHSEPKTRDAVVIKLCAEECEKMKHEARSVSPGHSDQQY